jgi:two-component system sensor histidine kinase UhpB
MVLIFGVQSTLKTSVHYIQQQQLTNLDLARQIIEAKINLLENYPPIEVRPEKLPVLFKIEQISNQYIIIEIFDFNDKKVTSTEDPITGATPQWLFNFLGHLFRATPAQKLDLNVGGAKMATVVLRPDRNAEFDDVWSDAVEKLIPVFSISLIVILSVIAFSTIVIKPIIEFLKSVQPDEIHPSSNWAQMRGLFGLSSKLKGIGNELITSTNKVDDLNRRLLFLQEEERRRISAELHDEIGQHLTAIRFESAAITTARNMEETKQSAQAIDEIGREMSDIIRSMLIRLRPPELDELGLLGALQEMLNEWQMRNANIDLHFHCKCDLTPLSTDEQHNIYRIIQEALTNVTKHAGDGNITVEVAVFQRQKDWILFKISDDGVGTDLTQSSKGHGLKGMKERVESFSGNIEIDSRLNDGMSITVKMPINNEVIM